MIKLFLDNFLISLEHLVPLKWCRRNKNSELLNFALIWEKLRTKNTRMVGKKFCKCICASFGCNYTEPVSSLIIFAGIKIYQIVKFLRGVFFSRIGSVNTLTIYIYASYIVAPYKQPWPSGNALDSDQHGAGFEAQRRPLVTSGRASGPKCSCQN